MTAVWARIIMRYLSGALVSAGFISADFGAQLATDAELHGVLVMALGAVLSVIAEWAYRLAKRFGWAT